MRKLNYGLADYNSYLQQWMRDWNPRHADYGSTDKDDSKVCMTLAAMFAPDCQRYEL